MKLYGFTDTHQSDEVQAPQVLVEVTLVATPAELRRVAQFLVAEAGAMERLGSTYSHSHLSDQDPEFEESANLIVSSPYDHAV
jgi:hypothetical protein